MNLVAGFVISSMVFALTFGISKRPIQEICPFDTFGDINCEDEMAHLDNFAVQLQNSEPQARGLIMFYGGQTFRGRLPRQGEAGARAARIISYLVDRRGIAANRLVLIDGGYQREWHAVLWIVSPRAGLPLREPTIRLNEIKFRKGKATAREYRCQI